MVVKINEVRGKDMKKHSLKDIEKVYHQCKVNNENMKESDVKFKQIPNVLMPPPFFSMKKVQKSL